MEDNAKSRDHGALQREELEGMRGEMSTGSSQGPQPISMLSRTEPPSSLERQGEDEPDKKPLPVVPGGVDKVAGLGENRHGFAYAVESVKPEDLPEFVKQHDNTLFFPEKLMLMIVCIEKLNAKEGKSEKNAVVGWTDDETAFVIRNKEELTSKWLPLFFAQAKYSSFTRKLYRWGFRKINVTSGNDKKASQVIFGNLNFRRNHYHLMANMRSVTAAKTRGETGNVMKPGELTSDGVTKNVLLPQGTATLSDTSLPANLALLAQWQQLQGPFLQPPTATGRIADAWRNASLDATANQRSMPPQQNSSLGTNLLATDNIVGLYLLALSQLQGALRTPEGQQQLRLSLSLLASLQQSQQGILLGLGANRQQQPEQQGLAQLQPQPQGQQGQPSSLEDQQRLAQIAEAFLRFRSSPPPT